MLGCCPSFSASHADRCAAAPKRHFLTMPCRKCADMDGRSYARPDAIQCLGVDVLLLHASSTTSSSFLSAGQSRCPDREAHGALSHQQSPFCPSVVTWLRQPDHSDHPDHPVVRVTSACVHHMPDRRCCSQAAEGARSPPMHVPCEP